MGYGKIQVMINDEMKAQFKKMCKNEGLSMGQAVQLMIKVQIKKGSILKEDVVK